MSQKAAGKGLGAKWVILISHFIKTAEQVTTISIKT
jgi:hypothetical protein